MSPAAPDRPRNRFPRTGAAEVGSLGDGEVRFRLERALIPVHGFGDERWVGLGYDLEEIDRRKEDIVRALRSMIAHPDRGRYVNRSGAVAVLGRLERRGALPLLETVLRSPSERAVVRGWAALTIGRVGRARSVELLGGTYEGAPGLVRRFVIHGLEAARCREAVPVLARIFEAETNPVLCDKAITAMRRLERKARS